MKHRSLFPLADLQLFAEGGTAGDGGTGTADTSGETSAAAVPKNAHSVRAKNPLAGVRYGLPEDSKSDAGAAQEPKEQAPDRNAEFDRLIKGEYKDLYDAKVQETLKRRLKSTQQTVERYRQLAPTVEMLAKKYGLRPDESGAYDLNALSKAIEDDDGYYEKEALEKGVSVQQLKQMRKMERENADLRRQMQEQRAKDNAERLYAQWMEQAQQAKNVYPSFDLKAELQNPRFTQLLRSNIDVRTAYEVLHKDEIIPAAMQFTAKTVEQKLTNKLLANGARPAENGNGGQSAAITKSDVSQLTRADRREIIRRVQKGEKIRF